MNSSAQHKFGDPALFRQVFELIQGNPPFPWQVELYGLFCRGEPPVSLDLPTGLGKTSAMTVWLLARALADEDYRKLIPRRLVYVVDRRAVVDQATAEAEKLRDWLDQDGAAADIKARLGVWQSLAISTLRGQHLDNKEWLADPATSAIVVGTVDMVGSRLLFSGYGLSSKMRPYHAGLLGVDTLVVLDEAHLVPPFEALLKTIARNPNAYAPRSGNAGLVPKFRLMSLSATGREDVADGGAIFGLSKEDHQHPIVKQRLHAEKSLTLSETSDAKALVKELAECAWALGTKPRAARVLVYCHSRDDGAVKVKEALDKRAEKEKCVIASELLVGGRRVRERERLLKWLQDNGFVGERDEAQVPTFLIATSAGEVGVDMDADHMVCDLVEWERMVQRLGRVNRRGGDDRVAVIEIVAAKPAKEKKDGETWPDRLERLRRPIDALNGDASPAAIVALKKNQSLKKALQEAQTPPPLRPALSRALVDAWSMTSLEEHTGRPEIEPWLRGWVKDDQPQSAIVWRKHLPIGVNGEKPTDKAINAFFEEAAPQTSEILEAETWRAGKWLLARGKAAIKANDRPQENDASGALEKGDLVLFVLNSKDELDSKDGAKGQWTLGELAGLDRKEKTKEKEAFEKRIAGRTLVVSSLLGGLNCDGMLDQESPREPSTLDADERWEPARPFRVSETSKFKPARKGDWRESYRLTVEQNEDGDATRWIVVEQRLNQPQSEEVRSIAWFEQTLKEHQSAAERFARDIAERLNLPPAYSDMLAIAARLHDEGKQVSRWQRAFQAPRDGQFYAKTKGPIDFKRLDGYRHEFGSLPFLQNDAAFKGLPSDLQDLALHLVAAHHGNARPIIETRSCEDAPPTALRVRARDVTLRFARLQKQWGPWGLAWWESLLRAADQQASRENDAPADGQAGNPKPGESE